MVFLPDSEGPRDLPREEAARRQRVRFARDVGDEEGIAWAHEPRRRRSKLTVGTAAVLVGFGALGLLPILLSDSDGALVEQSCDRVAVGAGPGRVGPGGDFAWQAAGPETGAYVVALDADEVSGPAQGPVQVPTGRVLAGPTGLSGCRSAQTVTSAPAERGGHEIVLFRHNGTRWERASIASLQVS